MTRKEKQAVEYSRRFKDWDYIIAAKDAYLAAYEDAKQEAINICTNNGPSEEIDLTNLGNEEVEMEFKDGDHQLSSKLKRLS